MKTEFEVGDVVTMRCSWLRSVGAYFDSPQHHEGDVCSVHELEGAQPGPRVCNVRWRGEWEADEESYGTPVLTCNLILWSERHLEPT